MVSINDSFKPGNNIESNDFATVFTLADDGVINIYAMTAGVFMGSLIPIPFFVWSC